IMTAVEPDFTALRREVDQRAMRQPVHTRRPLGLRDTDLEGCLRNSEAILRAHRRNREAGILVLVPAVEPRRRQVEQAIVVLIDEPATLFRRGEVLAGDLERRAQPRGLLLDRRQGVALLRS